MGVRRYDVVVLDASQKTPEGYLDFPSARLTKTGVFKYRREDGTEQLELRLPEHVFHDEAMRTFDGQPLTLNHPPANLTAHTFRDHVVGIVRGPHKDADGTHVTAHVRVMDSDAVRAVESGMRELSNGYDCDLVAVPGGEFQRNDVNEGKPIKAHFIQTNIRGNHTALVSRGRAGPTARLDSAGHEIEEAMEKELKEALEKIKALEQENAELKKSTKADAETQGRLDALERQAGEYEMVKAELAALKQSATKSAIQTLAERVAPILKKEPAELVKMDGGEDAIMRATLKKLSEKLPADFDKWSSKRVEGAFEYEMSKEGTRVDTATEIAKVVATAKALTETETKADADVNASEAAYRGMIDRYKNAWKTPREAKA